jgi:nucleoid-associated protein YgaU
MGFFDFFKRKKKEKPVDKKPEPKLEPVKENRTDRPFGKEGSDIKRGKGQRRNFKGKPSVEKQDQNISRHPKNISSATSRPATKHYTPRQQNPTSARNYTVKAGDSLSRIAKEFYGNANDWQKIYQANKNRIKDPNIIHPGQKLIIP